MSVSSHIDWRLFMSEEPTQALPEETATLGQIVAEMRVLNARLQRLEEKSDARSRETQPMSERIDQILAEVASTRHELREVNRTLRRMNADLATALRNQDDLEIASPHSKHNRDNSGGTEQANIIVMLRAV